MSCSTPVQVVGSGGTGTLSGVTQVAAGYTYSLVRKSDGTVWGWGDNSSGQLGDGTYTSRTSPVQASGLTGMQSVAAAGGHSLALTSDGSLWGWGGNNYGQVGDGSESSRPTPVGASGGVTGMTSAVAGFQHSFALAVSISRTQTTTYSYDKLYRLTGATGPNGQATYSYDPTGNRLSKVLGGTTTSYSYDKADRILSAGSTGYTLNANGNETVRGSDTFSYDQANRLTSVTVNGVTSTYTYDGDGKRISKTVAGVTTTYVYDIGGGLPVLLDDGSQKYVWGAGGLADSVDKSSGAVQVYHTDGLGSVRALTDSTGSVTQTYQTDEFGVPLASGTQGTAGQPFSFTGEQRDPENGLVYLRARMYDPSIGRFIQRDVTPGRTESPMSLNRYGYSLGNPISLFDPSGFDPLGVFAHQMIEDRFTALYPTFRAEVLHKDPNAPWWNPLLGSRRVDLEDPTARTFYEIKPWSERMAGRTQVADRIDALDLRAGDPVGDLWIEGWLKGLTVHAWWDSPGLLLYETTFELPDGIPFPFPFPGRKPSRLPRTFPRPQPQPGLLLPAGLEGGSESPAKSSVLT